MTTITKLVLLPNVNAALDILARFFDGEPEGVYDARGRKVLRAARAELAQFTDAVDATLTPRELAHVMAVAFTAPHDCEDVDGGPLDSAEIDALCERLNSGAINQRRLEAYPRMLEVLRRVANAVHQEGCRWWKVPFDEAPCECWEPDKWAASILAEIDALCERLNSGGESEAEAHRREIGPEAWGHQKVRCEGTCGRTFHPMELDENWKCRDCRGA